MRFKTLAAVLILVCTADISRAASIPAVGYDPVHRDFDEPLGDISWGWSFQVSAPVVVTHLGWRDRNGDGLSHPHRVGIWKVTDWYGASPILAFGSREVPAGSEGELFGPWRRFELPVPRLLDPGYYVISGEQFAASTDPVEYGFPSAGGDSRIALGLPGYSTASGFQALDRFFIPSLGYAGEFGPMFFVQEIPEPSCLAQVLIFAMITQQRQRKRNV